MPGLGLWNTYSGWRRALAWANLVMVGVATFPIAQPGILGMGTTCSKSYALTWRLLIVVGAAQLGLPGMARRHRVWWSVMVILPSVISMWIMSKP